MFICASLLASILSAAVAAARPALHDLGNELVYVRLEKLPGDATALIAAWPAPALIVDLRRAAGDAPENMEDDLPLRPRPEPVFVLVSSATPAGALAFLHERAPGLITLGSAATEPRPDLPIAVSPEADRRAYDAFTAGTSLDSLASDNISKPRFDEAALLASKVRGHANGGGNAVAPAENRTSKIEGWSAPDGDMPVEDQGSEIEGQPALDAASSRPSSPSPPSTSDAPGAGLSSAASAKEEAPAPPVDGVLRRAVQLHRALIALGRLPRS